VIAGEYLQLQEYGGFSFGPITEGDQRLVDKGVVEIIGFQSKLHLPETDFLELALELAVKALEAEQLLGLKNRGLVDDKWIKEMNESISGLESRLKKSF
jgi:hypothetical protein